MRYLFIFFVFILCLQNSALGQDVDWVRKNEIPLHASTTWQADIIGNVYVVEKDVITKYDTSGVKLYSQSIKSLGRINHIENINALKLMLFAENQQTVAFTDNTLTSIQEKYNLSDLGFAFVTLVAVSSQANKLWIYDQINSKIMLLDLSNTNQSQEIENLRGLLSSKEIVWMKEVGGKLYMADKENNLFQFDRYGSLLNLHKLGEASTFELFDQSVLLVQNGEIVEFNLASSKTEKLSMPFPMTEKIQWRTPFLFVQQSNKLIKYQRILKD